MKTKMYSVFDTKAECFGTPFFMPNRAMAERAFSDLAKDPKTLVSRHPNDFILYEIGEYDDATAVTESIKPLSLGFPKETYEGNGKITQQELGELFKNVEKKEIV